MTQKKKKRTIKVPIRRVHTAGHLLAHFGIDPKELPRETFVSGLYEYVDLYGCYGLPMDEPDRTFPRKDSRIDGDKERFMVYLQFVKEGAHTFYDRRSDTYVTEGGTIVGARFGAYIYVQRKVIRLESLSFPFDAQEADEAVRRLFREAETEAG